MSVRYQIWLKDHSGTRVALIDDFKKLEVTKVINGYSYHTLILIQDNPAVALFEVDYQLEIYRSDLTNGIDWYLEYEGFHRTEVLQTREDGQTLFTSYGRSYEDLLRRRSVLYSSGTSQSDKSGPGETVMKEYVNENVGALATVANTRRFDGVTTGFTVEADLALGATWDGARPWRNILEVCQEIALTTGIDFGVVGVGAGLFEFRTKPFPWGTDRTNVGLDPTTGLNAAGNVPVLFSIPFGNMERPVHSDLRTDEGNAVIVMGQGTGVARVAVERSVPDLIDDSPWNRCEVTRQGVSESTVAGLNAIGDQVLTELADKDSCSFSVLQIPSCLYGRDYFVGDAVTAFYFGEEHQQQITQVAIIVEGYEQVNVSVDPYALFGRPNPLLSRIRGLEASIEQ